MDKVILWDWDGTLVDSFPTIHEAYNKTRSEFGLEPWSFEETKKNNARSARDVFPEMFGNDAEAAEALFYKTYAELAPSLVKAKSGRGELLKAMSDMGYRHLLISNKRGDILRQECEALGWADYFHAVIGAGDADEDKPSAAPIALAYKKANLAHAPEHYYIGDAPIDAHTARAANIKCLLLVGETHNQEYLAPHSDTLMDYPEFRKWVLQTSNK